MKKLYNALEIGGYSEFKCIGPECEDDCCKGWAISIDKKTFVRYNQINDKSVRKKVKSSINNKVNLSNGIGIFILDRNGSCILQEEDKLCFIHKNLGEKYLCKTCRQYPKVVNSIDGVLELSCLFSCPVAAKEILLSKDVKEFAFKEVEIDSEYITSNIVLNDNHTFKKNLFWDIRSASIHILQCRKYKLWQRIIIAGFMFEKLEEAFNLNDKVSAKKIIEKYKGIVDDEDFSDINIPVDISKKRALIENIYRFIIECMSCSNIDISKIRAKEIDLSKSSLEEILKLVDKYEYIFENYLVNYIFQNMIPLDINSLTEQYYRMIFNYGFIIALLYGKSSVEKLDENSIIEVIYLLTRSIAHNTEKVQAIEKEFKRNNAYSLAYITLAVKF